MTDPAPNWYADPTTRYELRYWNGARWTEHVASAGVQRVDPPTRPVLGWVGLILCLLAVVAVAVPGAGYVRAQRHNGVRIDASPHHLDVPAHRTYGVYVDDADNSGYSESCSALDEGTGGPIPMRDPSWSMSSSDTETLDLVFDTGTGKVSISCSVPGEQVTVREVPHDAAMLLGALVSIVLGVLGAGMLIVWAVVRLALSPGTLTASTS